MTQQLIPFQEPLAEQIGLPLLRPGGRVINALCTGSGKTFIACELIRRDPQRTLIICPKSVMTNWHRVAERFGVELAGVVNPERISLGRCEWYDGTHWFLKKNNIGRIIWDEVHKGASGESSKATEALLKLRHWDTGQVMVMSATVADSPLKLRAIGGLFGLHNGTLPGFRKWCMDHGCKYVANRNTPGGRWVFRALPGQSCADIMAKIRKDLGDRFVSIKQNEIPGFPECQIRAELFDLDARSEKELNALYEQMPAKVKEEASKDDMVARLRARQKAEYYKLGLFEELIIDALEENLSPVVFLNFRDSLFALHKRLVAKGITKVSLVYGEQEDRQVNLDAFQRNDNLVTLATSGAGGVGVDMHDVLKVRPRVTYINPGENAADMVQVLGRTHRAGGTAVVQTFVLAAGTVEEQVQKALDRKLQNIDSLNSGDLTLREAHENDRRTERKLGARSARSPRRSGRETPQPPEAYSHRCGGRGVCDPQSPSASGTG